VMAIATIEPDVLKTRLRQSSEIPVPSPSIYIVNSSLLR
jgi:hypothetical protein